MHTKEDTRFCVVYRSSAPEQGRRDICSYRPNDVIPQHRRKQLILHYSFQQNFLQFSPNF